MSSSPVAVESVQADASKKVYFLPSDSEERKRLAIQHNLVLSGSGGKHIHAPVGLESISAVLETATGSGIWLEEVAKQLPSTAELFGVDLSPNLFPASPPLNIRFLQGSVLELPKEWTNKFDLVHQRLLVAGLRKEEWFKALGEIYRVLKPGGWFQLYEIVEWEKSGPAQKKIGELMTVLFEARGVERPWLNGGAHWQKYMEEAGFKDLRVTWHGWPMGRWAGEEGLLGKESQLGFLRGVKAPVLKAGGFGIIKGEEDFDELVAEVGKELDNVDGTRMRCIMICGQKPE
ncbi:hypothetical protein D9756_011228 [Leucocoprinus leucothites]|uniref:Methyltransferase domain-containing protein n=1 Tax=Leucocoprinus leucothites TaxID=201217 RepID=A0A8H5FPR9_9AGAR|nr:hypothetical protein D9756_011228 [Leucoagaricus leucothites]